MTHKNTQCHAGLRAGISMKIGDRGSMPAMTLKWSYGYVYGSSIIIMLQGVTFLDFTETDELLLVRKAYLIEIIMALG